MTSASALNLEAYEGYKHDACKPFIKWAGGKTKLLPKLQALMPKKFGVYFEPFVGGGALFFNYLPGRAVLGDANPELINAYGVVQSGVEALISDLSRHEVNSDYYYKLRDIDRSDEFKKWTRVRRASRFIYLNKTCFNGLYRVNSKGYFNVPFGDNKNPTIVAETNLRKCSKALQGAELVCSSFEQIAKDTSRGDFVYFDPPYAPRSETSSFTGYSKGGFGDEMQGRLADLISDLTARGVYVMGSNSVVPLTYEIYRSLRLHTVHVPRAINSKGAGRGAVAEFIVCNYRP